jgi:hypothetical protein
MTIYLADLLEGNGRAFHLAPSTGHLGGTAELAGRAQQRSANIARIAIIDDAPIWD